MPDASESEAALQHAVNAAVHSGRRTPWGDLRAPLALAAGVTTPEVRCIGMQDDSVITRAINSPGMTGAQLRVHGFVVLPATNLDSAVEGLRHAIETQPHIATAVVFPAAAGYRPALVLSRDEEIATRLRETLPNAEIVSDLVGRAAPDPSSPQTPTGPWLLRLSADVLASRPSAITVPIDDPNLRSLACGDQVALATDGQAPTLVHAAGEVAAIALTADGVVVTLKPAIYFPGGPVPLDPTIALSPTEVDRAGTD